MRLVVEMRKVFRITHPNASEISSRSQAKWRADTILDWQLILRASRCLAAHLKNLFRSTEFLRPFPSKSAGSKLRFRRYTALPDVEKLLRGDYLEFSVHFCDTDEIFREISRRPGNLPRLFQI
eukprot:gb/GEZJ01006337.1/.p1 GENE.gb/GEZJ01006337.1/~~gb/GEZJ01006337.1/.p1  ORF type:complete len:123 (+),score=6.16 gb/GEZJ01006337.1/:939-1307(+)